MEPGNEAMELIRRGATHIPSLSCLSSSYSRRDSSRACWMSLDLRSMEEGRKEGEVRERDGGGGRRERGRMEGEREGGGRERGEEREEEGGRREGGGERRKRGRMEGEREGGGRGGEWREEGGRKRGGSN